MIEKLKKLEISLYKLNHYKHSFKIASIIKEVSEENVNDEEADWEKILGQKPAVEEEEEWLEGSQGQSWIQILENISTDDDYETIIKKLDESNKFSQSEDSPEGDYRIVLFPLSTSDFVVKIGKDSAGNMMNKEDFMLGNYSDIMTKCYKHDPMFRWVVMDKIKVIGHNDRDLLGRVLDKSFRAEKEAYITFCRNLKDKIKKIKNKIPQKSGIEKERIMPGHPFWNLIKGDYLAISKEINQEYNEEISDENDEFDWVIDSRNLAKLVESDEFRDCENPSNIFKCIKNSIEIKRNEEGILSDISEVWNKKIRNAAGKTYLELSNAVSKFGISIKDIRPNNIGCDSKYNFKLIDSSIEETMINSI